MANIKLYPPYGTIKEASSVKFEISDVKVKKFNINVENATHGIKIDVKSFKDMGDGSYAGVMDLNIPEHSSQASISIFVHIDALQDDGTYKILQICPTIFEIKEDIHISDKNFILNPTFIGQKDSCSIKTKGEPHTISIFSVNDKIYRVITDENGYGSIHFKGEDIVGNGVLESINKIPVYIYEGENNTRKVFGGSYLNILPSNIALHATIDPRCSTPGPWVRPEECDDVPCDPTIEICDCDPTAGPCPCNPLLENCDECDPNRQICDPAEACIPAIDIPTSCNNGDITINSNNICRIYSDSVVLLNNGMVLYAYMSPDKTLFDEKDDERFNINRVFIAANDTTPIVQIIANRDVIVESKTINENFRVRVDDDIWDALVAEGDLSLSNLYIVFYDASFGFQKAKIIALESDEYIGNVVIAETGNTNVILNSWVFCINSVIYRLLEEPSIYIDGVNDFVSLPYVRNDFETGNYVQPVNVSIATNKDYVGREEETYVYFIVEAVTENNLSQLYFNSLSLGKDAVFSQQSYGWVRLTDETQGNNRNPKATMDSAHNLHVIFESDRGGIVQLYYGNMGLDYTSVAAATFSSSIDKYSEFLSRDDVPFDYFQPLLLKIADDQEYFPIPEFDTGSLVSNDWNVIQNNGGDVVSSNAFQYLNNLKITSNPLSQEAIAIASLKIIQDNDLLDPSNQQAIPYLQFNYQISFDLLSYVIQDNNITDDTVVDELNMDVLFNQWKGKFTTSIDSDITNQPVYIDDDNNKFIIGRVDNVFDRIVPLVGAYEYNNEINPSAVNSQIKILKNDSNLKDFTFGIMFEKTYFKATNIQAVSEYAEENNADLYVEEEIEAIFTGGAKLIAFIKTEEKSEVRSDHIIVREFPEVLNVSENTAYDIIVSYVKMNSEEVGNTLDTYNNSYNNKFLGTLTLLINGAPRFSQSFISTLTNDYNFFDIGFGSPDGGYYIADKMAPSKLGVFDNITAVLNINNISITSPFYTYNDEVVSLPQTVRNITKLRVLEENLTAPIGTSVYQPDGWENNLITLNFMSKEQIKYFITVVKTDSSSYEELFNVADFEKVSIEFATRGKTDRMIITTEYGTVLRDTGFIISSQTVPLKFDVDVTLIDNIYITVELGPDVGNTSYNFTAYFKKVYSDNTFIQTPITFEGINQSASLDIGICNDVHITWQSNKSRYWDIYYTSSVDELSPFRYDTQITNTESNSIKPSVSVSRSGSRMIAWNDNRDGDYGIYAARSLEGYDCNQKTCETKMLDTFDENIVQCSISFDFEPTSDGYYNFILYFYSDSALTTLFKTITLEGNESKWFINGLSIISSLVYDDDGVLLGASLTGGNSVTISYSPDKDDKIFDIILHVRLNSVFTEIGV